jgi:hypothetical protein
MESLEHPRGKNGKEEMNQTTPGGTTYPTRDCFLACNRPKVTSWSRFLVIEEGKGMMD